MTTNTFIVNGEDFSDVVERDSYETAVVPVMTSPVVTMDGVSRCRKLRDQHSLTIGINPQSAGRYREFCAAVLNTPCVITFTLRQSGSDVTDTMTVDSVTAQYMSRCMAYGLQWDRPGGITFTQL